MDNLLNIDMVRKVIDSNVEPYDIYKAVGVQALTIKRLRSGASDLENLPLRTLLALQKAYVIYFERIERTAKI